MLVGPLELSEYLGITDRRVKQLVSDEGMPKQGRGKYDLKTCVRWYIDFKLKTPHSTAGGVNDSRKRLLDEQTKKTQLEIARIQRESIPAEDYQTDMNQLAVLYTGGLESVSGRLSAELAGISDAAIIAERIEVELNAVRETVADAVTAYSNTFISS